jgi:hypothetical protein
MAALALRIPPMPIYARSAGAYAEAAAVEQTACRNRLAVNLKAAKCQQRIRAKRRPNDTHSNDWIEQ